MTDRATNKAGEGREELVLPDLGVESCGDEVVGGALGLIVWSTPELECDR